MQEATELLKDGIDLVTDADKVMSNLLSYPLNSTLTRYAYTFLSCLWKVGNGSWSFNCVDCSQF